MVGWCKLGEGGTWLAVEVGTLLRKVGCRFVFCWYCIYTNITLYHVIYIYREIYIYIHIYVYIYIHITMYVYIHIYTYIAR